MHSGESSGMRLTEGAAAETGFHGDGERVLFCAMWATQESVGMIAEESDARHWKQGLELTGPHSSG